MEFTSNLFFLFALIFFALFFVLHRLRASNTLINLFISAVSFLFYTFWYPPAALIVVFLILLTRYGAPVLVAKPRLYQRVYLGILILLALTPLLFFKYYNFLTVDVFGINQELLKIILPVGISFYTFTVIGYLFDVARGDIQPMRSVSDVNLFITFWPHLASGPILRSKNIFENIRIKEKLSRLDWNLIAVMIMAGVVKKFLIADNIGSYVNWNMRFGVDGMTPFDSWMTLAGFAAQIYADFSGYSDMAIGFALMLGFRLPANFHYPYRSTTLTEFWRRWHISLSYWFRDYVYIPLGGSRSGEIRSYLNLLMVFFLSGIWHGPAFNFIIWGLIHGVVLVFEKIFHNIYSRVWAWLRWLITMMFVLASWSYFMTSTKNASLLIAKLVQFEKYMSWKNVAPYNSLPILALLLLLVVDHLVQFYRVDQRGFPQPNLRIYSLVILATLFLLSLFFKGAELPFIYFQF